MYTLPHSSYDLYIDGKWVQQYEDGMLINNIEEIKELLPTADGFFFGSTEYDEYYLKDIKNTIEILEKVIKEDEELNKQGFYPDYEYRASW